MVTRLDYYIILFSKKFYKLIATNLSKQQALDAGLKAKQQIDFIENQDQDQNIIMFLILENVKETIFDFSKGTVSSLKRNYEFILLQYNINIK